MRRSRISLLTTSLVISALFIVTSPRPARAALTFYSTQNAYNAATTGNSTLNFEDVPTMFLPTPPGTTVGGVNFTIDRSISDGNLFRIANGAYAPFAVLSSQKSPDSPNNFLNNLLITLPSPVTSFALDFNSFNASPFTFTLSTGETFTAATPGYYAPSYTFLGVTSTVAITSISISAPHSDFINLEDFTFGTAAAVPEPGSFSLMIAGFAVAGLSLARSRRAVPAAVG